MPEKKDDKGTDDIFAWKVVILLKNEADSNTPHHFCCSQLGRDRSQNCRLSSIGKKNHGMLTQTGFDPL